MNDNHLCEFHRRELARARLAESGRDFYLVTSIEDDGPGTYRDALSKSNRDIRFDPALDGQVIRLHGETDITSSNITVDGTGRDIIIEEGTIRFSGGNVTLRNLHFRRHHIHTKVEP